MKYLFVIALAVISGCKEYTHTVTVEMCTGETRVVVMTNCGDPSVTINTYKQAVPVLECSFIGQRVLNVCEVISDEVIEVSQ